MTDRERFYRKPGFQIPLICLVALLTLAIAFWKSIKSRFIRHQLSEAIFNSTNGLYRISYDSLRVDEAAGNLTVVNLRIIPDTDRYAALLRGPEHPPILVRAEVPLLTVTGVKTPRAALNRELAGSTISLFSPTITLYYGGKAAVPPSRKPWYGQLMGTLGKISMDTVSLNHARIDYFRFSGRSRILHASGLKVTLFHLRLDTLFHQDSSNLIFSGAATLQCPFLECFSDDGWYHFDLIGVSFDSRLKICLADSVKIIPQLDEETFARTMKVQKDRYDFWMEGVYVQQLLPVQLMKGRLIASRISIRSASFKVYHDLSLPRGTQSRVGHYPQQELMKIPFPVQVSEVTLDRGFIQYKEKNPRSDSAGKIQFFNASASLGPVTNIVAARIGDGRSTLRFQAKFMGLIPARATLVMWPWDSSGRFSLQGDLEGFELGQLNPVLEPMGLIRADQGTVQGLDFQLDGDNYKSSGSLVFRYSGIRLSLLKKDKVLHGLKEKTLASLVTALILKSGNPSSRNQPARKVRVQYSRDILRSFFNLIWKSIWTGVKRTVGL